MTEGQVAAQIDQIIIGVSLYQLIARGVTGQAERSSGVELKGIAQLRKVMSRKTKTSRSPDLATPVHWKVPAIKGRAKCN